MLTKSQMQMLRDLSDGDPTDYADFSDRAGSALGWLNRDRVMKALERKGLIDDDNKLTEAGRAALTASEPPRIEIDLTIPDANGDCR